MPELQIVSLEEAQGQGRFVLDYVALIQQVPEGRAGKLILSDEENPVTARKWLILAAKAMDIPLGIRRRGRTTIYFWVESPLTQEQPTGAQQRRSRQAQPFIIDEEQEETDEMEDTQPE
jgi:hypothetical protein